MTALTATLGLTACPSCGGLLQYAGMGDIEIYDAECHGCHRQWRVVKYPDGRTEVREKTES